MKHSLRIIGATALLLAFGVACDDGRIIERIIIDGPPPPASEAELIVALEDAYRTRSLSRFEPLFHADFWYFESTTGGSIAICRNRWICLHRRLFEPQNIPPSDPPLPPDLWLVSISISVAPESAFVDEPAYYRSDTNPGGLDPARWRATAATGAVSVLFETQGETDYQVSSRARFVVANDRSKASRVAGKYTFYRIEVVDSPRVDLTPVTSWIAVLDRYDGCDACPPPPPMKPQAQVRATEAWR